MHRVIRGIFGFPSSLSPLSRHHRLLHQREGMSLPAAAVQRRTDGTGEQLFQIMFIGDIGKKAFSVIGYLYTTAADDAFQSGGVINAVLAYPFCGSSARPVRRSSLPCCSLSPLCGCWI